jgi:acetyl esterase/lipase
VSTGVEMPLWDGPAPGSESWDFEETVSLQGPEHRWIRNVTVPTLTAYVPEVPSEQAVVVLPGGALHFVSIDGEGHEIAELLRASGVAAYVVKYRVVPTPADEQEFSDALMRAFVAGIETVAATTLSLAVADTVRAIELVRARGHRHVTLLGFSAGGRITSELVLRERQAAQPDAAAFVYTPWVGECVVPSPAPPIFVLAAADDPLGIDGSLDLHRAWCNAGQPVELHLFEQGGHGFGTHPEGTPVAQWTALFLAWLHTRNG